VSLVLGCSEKNLSLDLNLVGDQSRRITFVPGLWLNRDKSIVGAILGICTSDVFLYRMKLCVVDLHGEPG